MKILSEEKFKVRMRVSVSVAHRVMAESSEGENEVKTLKSQGIVPILISFW